MLFFAVDSCALKGCLSWRMGNKCAKDQMDIHTMLKYSANIHDSENCLIRKQMNDYRLTNMLEK
jgi:hypothetical protein